MNSILLSIALLGQVSFSIENPGIEPQLAAIKSANPTGWWPWGVTAWDQNGDGRKDVLITMHSGHGGMIFRQNADGTFTDANAALGVTYSQLPNIARPVVADFNGDGVSDLGGIGLSGASKVFLNLTTSLSQTTGTLTPIGQGCYAIDANGDGKLDGEAWSGQSGRTFIERAINKYPASQNFTYSKSEVPLPSEFPQSLKDELPTITTGGGPIWKYCDLDADGDQDCVVQFWTTYTLNEALRFGRYLVRDSAGVLQDVSATCGLPLTGCVPMLDSIADHNGDGKLDIILSHKSGQSGLYVQGANCTFTHVANATLDSAVQFNSNPYPYSCLFSDFDSDGDQDIVIFAQRLDYADVFERTPAGYVRWGNRINCWGAQGIDIADMTGDGKPDILIGGQGPVVYPATLDQAIHSVRVLVYRNTSAATPPPPPPPPPPGALRYFFNNVEQPQGTLGTIDGVPIPGPIGTSDKVIRITTP